MSYQHTHSFKQCILAISDIHCGSIYGMLPPGFKTSDGKIMPLNGGQKHLWKCWEHLIGVVGNYPVSAVVLNGDVIDGCQYAQRGTELSLPMMADQSAAATDILMPLRDRLKGVPFYAVQGTEYHDSKAGREAEIVAKDIGALPYAGLGTGRYSHEVLDLDVDGVITNFSHGIGVSSGLYRATAPDREALFSALAGKDGKAPKADCVVRSHVHNFVHVEHATKHVVITPCWQLQTRYMRKNSVYRMIPEIGAVLIWLDPEAKRQGEDPILVQKQLYTLPPVRATKLAKRGRR